MAYLIDCPFCGPRTSDEFYVRGDASKQRPETIGDGTMDTWHDYVHIRENVRGRMAEHWHHTGGCRQWLVVERDTVSHEIYAVTAANKWKGSSTRARKTSARKTPARKATSRKAAGRKTAGRAKT